MIQHFSTDVSCHPATRGHDLFNLAFEGVLEAWCFLMVFFSFWTTSLSPTSFTKCFHGVQHVFTSASRFPQCHCPWLYYTMPKLQLTLWPKLAEFESWSVKTFACRDCFLRPFVALAFFHGKDHPADRFVFCISLWRSARRRYWWCFRIRRGQWSQFWDDCFWRRTV